MKKTTTKLARIAIAGVAALMLAAPLAGLPAAAYADAGTTELYGMYTADVLDTFRQYRCPKGLADHNISSYNKTYKTIRFKNGYKANGSTSEKIGTAPNCICGKGSVYRFVMKYHTW